MKTPWTGNLPSKCFARGPVNLCPLQRLDLARRRHLRLGTKTIPGMSGHGRRGDNLADAMAKSAARAMGSSLGRQIIRGVLGSLLGGKKR